MSSTSLQLPQTIGWYGITFRAPDDWSIGAIRGDRESGYLRVDDHLRPRLELKWQRAGSRTNLQSVLDKYLRDLARGARKRRIPFHSSTDLKILRKKKKSKSPVLSFHWRADGKGYGLIWRCNECQRIVIAQLSGPERENLIPISQRVLESLEDHGEQGWETWSIYGFQFEIPDKFSIERHRLLTGMLELEFANQRGERILVMRWARATSLLKSTTLEDWIRSAIQSHWTTARLYKESDNIRGHPAVRFRGLTRPILQRAKEKALHTFLRKPPPTMLAYGWRCDEQDKIFAVGCTARSAHAFLPGDVAESVVCH